MSETKILVPSLGESIVEATVARWLKNEGERVESGEPLVELETDKVNLEVGAEKSGVLARIERKDGEDVKIGDTLGVISDAPSAAAQPRAEPGAESQEDQPAPPAPETPPGPADSSEKAKATPSARRMAQEHNVDLNQISGTGS